MSEDENGELGDEWAAAMEQQGGGSSDDDTTADWGDAMNEQTQSEKNSETEAMAFQELDQEATESNNEDLNLDVILDVPVTISMEIGRTQINIRNLLLGRSW